MKSLGIFRHVNTETGLMIIAEVNADRVASLVVPDRRAVTELISKKAAALAG